MIGIIGGSGFEKFEDFKTVELLPRETPFGLTSSGFKRASFAGIEFLFISRHGEHHELLPSEINYRANIFAMKHWGVTSVVSFSAVGSLAKDYAPGDLVVPHQYIDRTKGVRKSTFLGEGLVGHVSLAQPVCKIMVKNLERQKSQFDFKIHFGQTYVCIEGPYFSTQAESMAYRQMGAQIIGMSNFPEYALAREAGLPYLPCCFVTDYDCWDDATPHVTVDEVIKVMKSNNGKGLQVLKTLLATADLSKSSAAYDGGLRTGLFMPKDAIPLEKNQWVETLMS